MMGIRPSGHCRDYRDLSVFQKARELAGDIIRVTEGFPRSELHGSVSQMRRAALSIASNIAEGNRRGSRREYMKFLRIALGSAAELHAQILISHDVGWINDSDHARTSQSVDDVSRWIWRLIGAIEAGGRNERGNRGGNGEPGNWGTGGTGEETGEPGNGETGDDWRHHPGQDDMV